MRVFDLFFVFGQGGLFCANPICESW